MRMVMFGSDEKRFETKAADHYALAYDHLAFNARGRVLDWNLRPVQILRDSIA
jgi:hypothetical protein